MAETLDLIAALCLGIGALAFVLGAGLVLVSLLHEYRTRHETIYRAVRLPEDHP
jgi:hypothetical protein